MVRTLLFIIFVIVAPSCGSSLAPSVRTITVNCPQILFSGPGQSTSCHAAATFADGTTADETTAARWASSAPSVATVSASGVVNTLAFGETVITATYQSVSASQTLQVQFLPPRGN